MPKPTTELDRLQEEPESGEEPKQLPPGALLVSLLGVNYIHTKTGEEGELYVTTRALPYLEHLKPESWYEKDWFEEHREKLEGTSAVYAVPTKQLGDLSLRLVVKYNRVGQDVPLETKVIYKFLNAEFNGPFEEFALVEEMRHSAYGPPGLKIRSQLPLAIYVPPERMQLWQTGRSEAKIASKIAKHPGIEIDILRDYILVYGWLEGLDAVEAHESGRLAESELNALTQRATEELKAKGYRVLDMKPKHIIVRPDGDAGLQQRDGKASYGLVDYELLERTPEYDRVVKGSRRSEYLRRQRDRFAVKPGKLPAHLKLARILDVDYVYGTTESTGGALWVVGRDPGLFDYFLPERWRKTPQIQLIPTHETYYTRTKDLIHLVWKVSRVGERPDADDNPEGDPRVLAYGYNSPFEEFTLALHLRDRGIPAIYPRAIYMTGHQTGTDARNADPSRYQSHAQFLTPEGKPVLRPGRDYVTVWGYWNGPDEMLANKDGAYFKGLNGAQALAMGLLNESSLGELLERERRRLAGAGVEALRLPPEHLLLSLDSRGVLINDLDGKLETRICNLQFLKRTPPA